MHSRSQRILEAEWLAISMDLMMNRSPATGSLGLRNLTVAVSRFTGALLTEPAGQLNPAGGEERLG